jgi:hypothetical protein
MAKKKAKSVIFTFLSNQQLAVQVFDLGAPQWAR